MQATVCEASFSTSSRWRASLRFLCAFFLAMDGAMKVMSLPQVREAQARLGYPADVTAGIGILLLACTALYVIPRTSVLGAILLTGYLGGATASQVRVGGPFLFPVVFGVLIWAALFVGDERLRALIPVRR